jgi:hypothetical protein
VKKKLAIGSGLVLAIALFCGFQTAPNLSAAYWPNNFTSGDIGLVTGYISGVPTMGPSKLHDTGSVLTYNGSPIPGTGTVTSFAFTNGGGFVGTVGGTSTINPSLSLAYTTPSNIASLRGVITGTAATTDSVTIAGITTSSKCTFSPSNSDAATTLPTVQPYITVTANTATLNFAATATVGATYNVLCTIN